MLSTDYYEIIMYTTNVQRKYKFETLIKIKILYMIIKFIINTFNTVY